MEARPPDALTPERWRELKQIFFQAIVRPPGGRTAFLVTRCDGDEQLLAEAKALLSADQALSSLEKRPLPPRPSTQTGFRGNDRFAIDKQLGVGGFGTVYRAFDRLCGRWVALKVLHCAQGEGLTRFKREFRAIAQLHLPNLVRCHELFAEGGKLFFTMELVDGLSFLDHVKATAHEPSWDQLISVFSQLARGVQGLHEAGWLHRDLKPSNVLVDRAGRVVILDLGLARSMDDGQPSEVLVGSMFYLAPERLAGAPATPASDWYSVGVMLYQSLTAQAPWASRCTDLVHEKTVAVPPPPCSLVPGLPAWLNSLCLAMISRQPEQRPKGQEILRCLTRTSVTCNATQSRRPQPQVSRFVGREAHLAALRDAYARCSDGRPSVVEVTGASGIGKTALVSRFLRELRGEVKGPKPAVILEGRCYQHESIGYKVFDGVVDALAAHLNRLPTTCAEALLPRNLHLLVKVFPVLLQSSVVSRMTQGLPETPWTEGSDLRRKAFDALRELLGRMAERQSLVVFIDDLQWGDRDSIAPLQRLLSSEDAPPLLLVVTYRSELADNPNLAELCQVLAASTPSHRRLAVGALERDEARRYAALLLGQAHPALDEVVEEAGGLPYFLAELSARVLSVAGMGAGIEQGTWRLDQLLLERVGQLPAEARWLLEVLSVARKPLSCTATIAAAGVGAGSEAALALLHQCRLTRPAGPGTHIEPYHDRIREVVEASLSERDCREAHRRIALALETEAGDAEEMAVHFRAAGDQDRAARYAILAADEATEQAAFNRAVRLYRMAIELRGDGHEDAAGLFSKLGDAQANAGMCRDAADSFGTAAKLDPTEGQEMLRRAAEQLLRMGEIDEGLSIMTRMLGRGPLRKAGRVPAMALRIVLRKAHLRLRGLGFRVRDEREVPRDLLLRIDLAWTAFLGLAVVDPVRAAYIHSQHILDALDAGEPRRVVRALAAEAGLAGMCRTGARFRRLLGELDRAWALLDAPGEHPWPSFAKTLATFCLGRWAESRREADAAEKAFMATKGRGASWELAVVRAVAISTATLAGDVRACQSRLQDLLHEYDERGDLFGKACLAMLGNSHILRLTMDQPEAAERELRDLRQRLPAARFPVFDFNAAYALADTALYMGRYEDAWAFFAQSTPSRRALLRASTVLRIFHRHLHARVALVLALKQPSRRGGHLRIAAADARSLLKEKNTGATGLAGLVLAGIACLENARAAATEHLQSAEAHLESAGLYPHLMMGRLARGRITPGAAGIAVASKVESWAAEQGIRRPVHLTAMFVPGVS